MFGLRRKSSDSDTEVLAGPLDRIGRRSPTSARSAGTPATSDRASRLAAAVADLGLSVAPRLSELVAAGAPAGEVTRQAGSWTLVHFRNHGIILAPLELRGYVADVLRPVLPATSFSEPDIAKAVPADAALPVEEISAVPTPDLSERRVTSSPAATESVASRKPNGWPGEPSRTAQGADKKLITDVTVFDVYEGKGIDDGKKSIAIAVTLQPREKTMTDEEIESVAAKIVAEVGKRTGAVLRS